MSEQYFSDKYCNNILGKNFNLYCFLANLSYIDKDFKLEDFNAFLVKAARIEGKKYLYSVAKEINEVATNKVSCNDIFPDSELNMSKLKEIEKRIWEYLFLK